MKSLNPIIPRVPVKIQNNPELSGFFNELTTSLYQIWFKLNGNKFPALISTTEIIDVTSTGVTELFKVPQNKTFVPLFIVIRTVDFTVGSKSVQAVASFGGNDPTFDDYLDSVTYTVAGNNTFQVDKPDDVTELVIQDENISFGVNIETASNADIENWTIDLFGYLV